MDRPFGPPPRFPHQAEEEARGGARGVARNEPDEEDGDDRKAAAAEKACPCSDYERAARILLDA